MQVVCDEKRKRPPRPQDKPGPAGKDPGPVWGPADNAGRAQLDLHRHHGHHRLEHAPQGDLPEALPPGPPRG